MDWTLQAFRDRRVTVMGLGLHGGGLGVATWLLKHGAVVTVTDLKDERALAPSVRALRKAHAVRCAFLQSACPHVRFVLGKHRAADFRSADLIVQNPGVPRESRFLQIAKRNRVPIENEASLFFRIVGAARDDGRSTIRTVGITGTRGKSTTSALIAAMLTKARRKVFLVGNIRKPMFDVLDAILRAGRRGAVDVVLELSSWHCEHFTAQTGGPDVAVITNIMRDHLNRYTSLRTYVAAKQRILTVRSVHRDARGIAVLNREDARVRAMAQRTKRRVIWAAPYRGRIINPALRGEHNRANVAIAATAARACDVSERAVSRAVRAYQGLPGRLEPVSRTGGVAWINDTCATTPDATIAALEALRGTRVVLIAGGTDKRLDYQQWVTVVSETVAILVILPGTATERMEVALQKLPVNAMRVAHVRSMRAAVRKARALAARGDTVVLSPGAASFGLFLHEFDRGDQFVSAVRAL